MKNRKGFTIVELVIVIAVIAILAAVLIPTFSSVTASARASAAQQQAKAGLDSILALTEGSLPEGTAFCITNSTDQSLNYIFTYTGNKLQQAEVESASINPYSTGVYAVYVTADAMGTDEAKVDAVKKLLLNVMKQKIAGCTEAAITGFTPTSDGKYYTLAYTGYNGDGDAPEIRVYYTSDIQETMVVFIGANS